MKRAAQTQAMKAEQARANAAKLKTLLEMHQGIIGRILGRKDLSDETKETMQKGYEAYIIDLRRPS